MRKICLSIIAVVCCVGMIALMAADHIDAPGVTGTKYDITDLYVMESPSNSNNLVFICNTQGLLDPTASASASFDANSMIEFNIDNDGDNVEDLVIQCIFEDGKISAYGPAAPQSTGTTSKVNVEASLASADITAYSESAKTGSNNGVTVFAGLRDDPFFFDFTRYNEILAGTATGFNSPGNDTFAGTNVMSCVVEVPKSQVGGSGTINVWVESKMKN